MSRFRSKLTSARPPHGQLRRLLVGVVVFVAFVVAAFRVPPVVGTYAHLSRIEVRSTDDQGREAIIAKDVELARVRAFRPLRGSEPSSETRLRDAAFGSPHQASIVALVLTAAATLGARGSVLKPWTPSAPTPADLMVFLN